MCIIGIAWSHDGTLTVFRDGENVFSIGEERLNRVKSYVGFPFQALRYVVEKKIVNPSEVEAIVMDNMSGFKKSNSRGYAFELTENKKYYDIQNDKKPSDFYIDDKYIKGIKNCESYVRKKLALLFNKVGIYAPIYFSKHHSNHAASAFYTSGFSDAIAITMDGEGHGESATVSICKNGRIRKISSTNIENSAGNLYSAVTKKCGFKISRHEGKITGLAAYGDYTKSEECFNSIAKVVDGKFQNVDYKKYSIKNRFLKKISNTFGIDYFIGAGEIVSRCGKLSKEDMSAAIQHLLEKRIVEIVDFWIKKTGIKTVVLSGGVFANVKFNQCISEIDSIDNLYIYPDMGDGGNAFGAAANYYYKTNTFIPKKTKIKNTYYGPEFSNEDIKKILRNVSNEVEFYLSKDISLEAAQLLSQNKIVGWFQGRMECGPRSLGNRSIIASPIDSTINQWLNDRMKRNEFMPFAPSCLYEYADDLFYIPKESMKFPAQFMTITFKMKKKWAKKAPAVAHVDQTARPQLVTKEANPKYHELLSRYYELTGLPLFINTSFNVHEEPIICTPEEAIKPLLSGVIDNLCIGDYICKLK